MAVTVGVCNASPVVHSARHCRVGKADHACQRESGTGTDLAHRVNPGSQLRPDLRRSASHLVGRQ